MIETQRLILRQWQASDFEPFAAMNQDDEVMRYFPGKLTAEQTQQGIERLSNEIENNGCGFWAVERKDEGDFIGFIGIKPVTIELPFSNAVEIGWRLTPAVWRKGYAAEGALASLQYGFEDLSLDEIVSFTPTTNIPSMGVMQKIGMQDTGFRFDHPAVAKGDPLQSHVLYKISKEQWLAKQIA
ncbi:GNAT family N-acetyltransferase [Neptunicella marina]|uniref:GNAT family N-acetyltransferase n=1 Tax=Neptunicella marina TaxID=2125989 RepID=A0A8J6ISE7_9ALTE|nr:GNAT family N-acetyltransferase [Neptunicella marina]MBC3766600.1 GNAT family N-acetyltransferase [Neptunicella marina]